MLRRDISRRYVELIALGWLGRAWLAAPFLFDALLPPVFNLQGYESAVAPCYRSGRRILCTLKEASVVARGIPFRLALHSSATATSSSSTAITTATSSSTAITTAAATAASDYSFSAATLMGIGPDLGASPVPDAEQMSTAEVAALCEHINTDRSQKRLVISAIVRTIFQRLTPIDMAAKQELPLEACGAKIEFAPRRDLWAQEGSTEKWLQQVAGYYFAEALVQPVKFCAPLDRWYSSFT
eukprot:Tamp_23867.p1 GENE.Tamp_23867~~Tamp_23867.p1  ORF type:complete len:241 (-),score=39.32 Tamp_23867:93-815(-)